MTQVQSPKEWLSTDTKTYTTPFESDFLITTMHWLARLGYGDAKPTRDWLSKFAVGRFTNAPAFNPNYGAAYVLSVRGTSGQTYDSWQAIFAQSTARAGAVGTTLRDSECPYCYPAIARAALAAAVDARVGAAKEAYAFVDADISRATTAKDPFQSDPTWAIVPEGTATAASAPSGTSPPQQAQPASGTPPQAGSPALPVPPQFPTPPSTGGAPATAPSGPTGGPSAWPRDADGRIRQTTWDSLPLNEWIEVPGTKLRQVAPPFRLLGVEGFAAIIDDWCGAAFDTRRKRMQMQCGGHQGYVGNEIVTLNLESMTVERIWGPDAPTAFWAPTATQFDYSVDPTTGLSLSRNNNPTAVHTYRTPVYIPEYDITVRLAQNPGPVVFRNDINDWDRRYQVPSSRTWSPGQGIPYAYSSRAMAFRGKYFAFTEEYLVYRWDPSRNTKKPDGSLAYGVVEQFPLRHPIGPSATSVEIPDTGEFIHFSRDGGPYPEVVVTRLDRPGASDFSQTATLQGVRELVTNPNWAAAGAAWIPELGRILVLENRSDGQPNRLMAVSRTGGNFTADWFATSGTPPGYSINGVYSRMQAVRFGSVILLVVVTHVDQNVRIIRVK